MSEQSIATKKSTAFDQFDEVFIVNKETATILIHIDVNLSFRNILEG